MTLPLLCGDHEKQYPEKETQLTMIWEKEWVALLYKYATHLIMIHENIFKIFKIYTAESTERLTALGNSFQSLFEVFALLPLLNKLYTSPDQNYFLH